MARGREGRRRPAGVAGGSRGETAHGAGETADFEVRVDAPGELRLEVDSPFAGWRVEVPVLVR